MRCRYRDLGLLNPVGRPRPPPQEVRLNRWHENSKAVFPPTNPAHVPASSPRWRAMQRALQACPAILSRRSAPRGGGSPPGDGGLRGHSQPLIAHAKLSVPALSERPLRVSRVAASVVSARCKIGTTSSFFGRLPTGSFQQQQIRAAGPAQNRVAPAFAGPLPRPEPCRSPPGSVLRSAAPARVLWLLLHTRAIILSTSPKKTQFHLLDSWSSLRQLEWGN